MMDHDYYSEQTAQALAAIARRLDDLGLGDAPTNMGALELLSKEVHDSGEKIAGGLHAIADAIARQDIR